MVNNKSCVFALGVLSVERPSEVLEVAAHITTSTTGSTSISMSSLSFEQLSGGAAGRIKGGKVETGRLIVAARTEQVVVQRVVVVVGDARRRRRRWAHGRPHVVRPLVVGVTGVMICVVGVVGAAVQSTTSSAVSVSG